MDGENLLRTGEAAELLGVSRQHVVDLCDRGELVCVWVGKHRRVPVGEVARLKGGGLSREQEKSLWLHLAVAAELLQDPDAVLGKARENLDRWRAVHRPDGRSARYLEEWRLILDSGVDAVVEAMTRPAEHAAELRQNTPFAGVISEQARVAVLRSFARHWAREHERHRRGAEAAG